jgi:hypothetical protein
VHHAVYCRLGHTAHHVAESNGHESFVQLLEQHSTRRSNAAMRRSTTASGSLVAAASAAAQAQHSLFERQPAQYGPQYGAQAASAAVSADADHQCKRVAPEAFEFKLILVGDVAVGKSAWLHRHVTGQFQKRYLRTPPPPPRLSRPPPPCPHPAAATCGVDVVPVTLPSTRGDIVFNVWDISGQEKVRVQASALPSCSHV